MLSRRRSKTLVSLLAVASVATLAASSVSATTEPPGTEPAGTEAAGTEAAGTEAAGGGGLGEVGGSGCGTPHGPYEDPGDPAGEVRVAWNDPLLSFNNNTIHANALANTIPLYLMGSGFAYYDGNVEYINNDSFGTCTVDSLDPLTVTYRINEGVTWGDGVQVDAADMLFFWGSLSTHFNSEDTVTTALEGITAAADESGSPIVVGPDGELTSGLDAEGAVADQAAADAYAAAFDPESGALLEGFTYKESAGVAFDASSEAYELISELPVVSEDGLALTMTYDTFFVDYQYSPPTPTEAAHIIGARALGIEDPAAAKQAVIDAFTNNDPAALKPMAEFWNTAYDTDQLPDDPGLYLSHGAYNLTSYTQRAELTFEAREDYTWGPQTHLQTIVYKIIGDPVAQAQAMENEEVDIISPQSTSDLLTQLQALEDRGIVVESDTEATYEHVDLAVNNDGPFAAATYGGDEATALAVRQAFLKTIPRQEIIDRLIIPLNPDAFVRNSFTVDTTFPTYEAMAASNGLQEAYGDVDIEGAVALLEGAGVETPIQVRFHYAANNPRRASEYELIRDSAAQAGFEVIDGANPDWGVLLPNTDIYDASMFGWASNSTAVTSSKANFVTDGANNYSGYSNETVDALFTELDGTSDLARQQEILVEVEQQLVADAFGTTIFQFPGLLAYNSTYVSGITKIPLGPRFFHDFWNWEAVGA